MPRPPVHWTMPAPFWPELAVPGASANGNGNGNGLSGIASAIVGTPAILRFATDNFIQDYLNVLATDPRKLGEFRAVPETWRGRQVAPTVTPPTPLFGLLLQRRGNTRLRPAGTGTKPIPASTVPASSRLKLYQPAHQRHYLLSACLICASPGFPDRRVDAGAQERASFVVRRLFPPAGADPDSDPAGWDEYAWIDGAWVRVLADGRARNEVVLEGEERLALFPANFDDDSAHPRRLFSGVIPVARRDAYLGATRRDTRTHPPVPPGTSSRTARQTLFRSQVAEPWKNLVAQAELAHATLGGPSFSNPPPPSPIQLQEAFRVAREQTQTASWLVLLDFAKYLRLYLPALADVIAASGTGTDRPPAERALLAALNGTEISGSQLGTRLPVDSTVTTLATSLADALRRIPPFEDSLEATESTYSRGTANADWPNFLFPLADVEFPDEAPLPPENLAFVPPLTAEETGDLLIDSDGDPNNETAAERIDKLTVLLVRALPATTAAAEPEIPAAAIPPVDNTTGVFRIRCVFERPACGPVHDDVVSPPTEPIEFAGYFDPDAPARPIRIGLPLDTSPAGLRKFDKNTAFVMSDILCGQVARMKGLTFGDLVRSVLPWPLHKDLSVGGLAPCGGGGNAGFGMICSLSIPIITLCALVLLLIMVALLDFIFRWMPFLMICFPIPGLKGKK